jgi:hypothetical protein
MTEKHWKEQWEDDADAELERLSALPIEELSRRVQSQELGGFYMIWNAIAAKGDLPSVGWQLFDFLNSPADYLHRYHCARTFLTLLRCTTYEPVDLTVAHKNPAKALGELEQMLSRAVGPRPAGT